MSASDDHQSPLIAHVIQRLATGGLENGLVNLINHMPADRYRHAIICLADATDYSKKIRNSDVAVFALSQRQGHDFGVHRRLLNLLRRLRPAIAHTRNLAALEFQVIAATAGVPGRVHGEHGRDIYDLDGTNRKYNLLRKTVRPFVQCYTCVSKDLAQWLIDRVGVSPERVTQIYNGVDAEKFHPRTCSQVQRGPAGFVSSNSFVIGTVGRMEAVKDQITLVRAFIHLAQTSEEARRRLRLLIIGEGPFRAPAMELLRTANLEYSAWLPGERDDVPDQIRSMDLFVLPSLREGISNTILEAMATGLPVVATRVGGNPELVEENKTGMLVPHSDPRAMAVAISSYLADADKALAHGHAGRNRIESTFTIEKMVTEYSNVYDSLLHRDSRRSAASRTSHNACPNV